MKANTARNCLSYLAWRASLALAFSSFLSVSLHAESDAGPSFHDEDSPAQNSEQAALSQNQAAVDTGILGLKAKIEPETVNFGEAFHLVVEVKHLPQLQVELPTKVPENAASPQVGRIRRDTLSPKNSTTTSPGSAAKVDTSTPVITRFMIPFLALGLEDLKTPALVLRTSSGDPVEIPELPVPVRSEENAATPAPAGGSVIDPAAPTTGSAALVLEEAPGPILFSVFDQRPFVVLATCILFALLYWLYRRFAGRIFVASPPAPPPPPPKRPAHEVALERLDALLAEGLLARAEINVFVTRLMDDVLRDFLEARFAVAAGRRTTRELMVSLLETSALGLDVGGTRAVLEQADLVKFARATLAADAAHEMAERVRSLIVATTAISSATRDASADASAETTDEGNVVAEERP